MAQQKLIWIGHGSWKLVTANGTGLYLDPWIKGNPACKSTMDDAMDADIVCVTHGHDDHIGNAIELCKRSSAVLVTLPDIGVYASHYGIPADDRGGAVHIGGSVRQKDCVIRAVQALHTSDIWGYEYQQNGTLVAGSGCCGMVIEPDGGKPVYFSGDTGVFSDMKLISELYHPYVSVLPIGDKYVMGIREASVAAGFLQSPIVVPGHYDTFPAIKADTEAFTRMVAQTSPSTRVCVLKPSEELTF